MEKDPKDKIGLLGKGDHLQALESWTNIQEAAVISRTQKGLIEYCMSQVRNVIALKGEKIFRTTYDK